MINFNREWKLKAGMVSANTELIRKDYQIQTINADVNENCQFCFQAFIDIPLNMH